MSISRKFSSICFDRKIVSAFLGLITVGTATAAHAQTTLAYWNFNSASTADTSQAQLQAQLFAVTGGVNAASASMSTNFTTTNPATTFAASGTGLGVNTFAGTTVNSADATPAAGQALALQGSSGNTSSGAATVDENGNYLQFNVSTVGYQNIMFSFATQGTGTGFNSDQVQYSTNGTSFTNFGTAYVPASSFATNGVTTINLSSVAALNNSTSYFRIVFNGATGNTGNNRIDNLQILGSSIGSAATPEPGALALMGLGALGFVGQAVRRRRSA